MNSNSADFGDETTLKDHISNSKSKRSSVNSYSIQIKTETVDGSTGEVEVEIINGSLEIETTKM